MSSRWKVLLGMGSVLLLSGGLALAQASFQGLGAPPGTVYISAQAVSADGSTVVGWYDTGQLKAFRWTAANGYQDLGAGLAYGVSGDGSVVVGESGNLAARWVNGALDILGDFPGGAASSRAYGVSADGSVIVGSGNSNSGGESFRWEGGMMTTLPHLPGSLGGEARGISADGQVIVGAGHTEVQAYRFADGVMTGLGDLPGGAFNSVALSVSADGKVVVGVGTSSARKEAFRWEAGSMINLGNGILTSGARAVSGDGSLVGGGFVIGSAFIWDAGHGTRLLNDVLVSDYGLDLTGWTLTAVTGISADGLTLVGDGVGPDGESQPWIAQLPEPGTLLMLMLGAFVLSRRRIR